MKKLNPLKLKYARFYWNVVDSASFESVAVRHTVGALAVTPTGLLLPGWNGTAPGVNNNCERGEPIYDLEGNITRYKTSPGVLHAENNVIGKAACQGVSLEGAHLYVSRMPCEACARAILPTGISHIFYGEQHDDAGFLVLQDSGIVIRSRFDQMREWDDLYGLELQDRKQIALDW